MFQPQREAMRTTTARRISCRPPAGGSLFLFLLLFFALLLEQYFLSSRFYGPFTDILVAVEVDFAVNDHFLNFRVVRERMLVVEHHVGVLARFYRSDPRIDGELSGR